MESIEIPESMAAQHQHIWLCSGCELEPMIHVSIRVPIGTCMQLVLALLDKYRGLHCSIIQ